MAATLVRPGRTLHFETTDDLVSRPGVPWTVPDGVKKVQVIASPTGYRTGGLLLTRGAAPDGLVATIGATLYISVDNSVPDAREYVRNTAARVDATRVVVDWTATEVKREYGILETSLSVGSTCVLLLIGASLLLSQLEQLRERRKLLAALVAFGTRRRTLSLSVLWQTAVPITFGMLLAVSAGLGLGSVLLAILDTEVTVDWRSVLNLIGVSAGVVLTVTLLSLPPLLRMLRPDGLRTE